MPKARDLHPRIPASELLDKATGAKLVFANPADC